MAEEFTVQLPDGTLIKRMLPDGATDKQVRAAFRGALGKAGFAAERSSVQRPSNEDYWREKLGDQGAISNPDFDLGETLEGSLGDLLSNVLTERDARRYAGKAFNFVNDLTPVGDAVGAQRGGSEFYNGLTQGDLGRMALGAGSFALSLVPHGGAAKRQTDGLLRALLGDTRGTFGGINARTADLEKLEAAQKSMAHPWDIHDDTGWSRGVDRKWRFEIDDSTASIKARAGRLGDVLDHPELFAAYPQLGDIPVHDFMPGSGANYERAVVDGVPLPGMVWMGRDIPDDRYKSILSHEIQHAVQDIEGFAGGGAHADLGLDAYRSLAGEVEARNVQRRLGMNAQQRTDSPFWLTQDTPTADQRVWFVGDILNKL